MMKVRKRGAMLDKLRAPQMDREVAALRQELDETRKALRTQTVRCRKLVAAFTARLREKEQEERQGREVRDKQLSAVLRALLVLEARLRKEQRDIQRQLQERDAVIRSQTLEIARLRRAARSESPRKAHRAETGAPTGDRPDFPRKVNHGEAPSPSGDRPDVLRKVHRGEPPVPSGEGPELWKIPPGEAVSSSNDKPELPRKMPRADDSHSAPRERPELPRIIPRGDALISSGEQHEFSRKIPRGEPISLSHERPDIPWPSLPCEEQPSTGVQHIIRKLENTSRSPESSTKPTSRRPLSAEFEAKTQNGAVNFGMKNAKSLENLDTCKHSYISRNSIHGTESSDHSKTKRSHGSLESLLQDNIESQPSEATVVEIRVVEEHYNSRNVNDGNMKNAGKRFVKHHIIKPSELTLNRFKTNRQKELSNNDEFITKLDCEETYGMDPVLDSDSGVFQGSSSEVSDSSLKSDCQDNSYQDQDDDMPSRDLYKDYQHNPVLECVSQILLRDEDDMEAPVYRSHNDDSERVEDLKKGRFNNLWPSIKEEQESQTEDEEINDTAVVVSTPNVSADLESPTVSVPEAAPDSKCDPKKSPSKDKIPSPPIKAQHLQEKACLLMSNQRLTLVSNPDFEEVDKKEEEDGKVIFLKVKTPPLPSQPRSSVPPALPPKPPQLGSMSRLRHKRNMFNAQVNQSHHPIHSNSSASLSHDIRQAHTNIPESRSESGDKSIDSSTKPRPPKSLDFHMNYSHPVYQEKPRQRQILSNGSLKRALNHENIPQDSRQFTHEHQDKNTSKTLEEKLDELNLSAYRHPVKVVGPVAARVQRQLEARPGHHDSGRHQFIHEGLVDDQGNGKSSSAPRGHLESARHQFIHDGHVEDQSNNKSSTSRGSHHESGRHQFIHDGLVEDQGNSKSSSTSRGHHEVARHQFIHDGLVDEQSNSKSSSTSHGAIKVGSSVSSLITGSTGGSIVTELTQGSAAMSEGKSQTSTPSQETSSSSTATVEENDGDEDGNATLRSNFEEFRLEDVDMDSVEEVGRPAGDGAESRSTQPVQNGSSSTAGSYEHFLEATGLSQKSIMTPSRMLSNHRNVIKPKDVKHRSRVLRAAAVNERCGTASGGPIVKYWIEPFL